MKQWLLIGALAFLVGLPAAQADVYNFNYTGTTVTASGTLSVNNLGCDEWQVLGITGTRNLETITGLWPAGPLPDGGSGDNIIYFAAPPPSSLAYFELSVGGLSFTTVDGTAAHLFNLYTTDANSIWLGGVSLPAGQYEYQVGTWPDSNQAITFELSAVPEPGFYGVLALGLSGLFVGLRRRRRA